MQYCKKNLFLAKNSEKRCEKYVFSSTSRQPDICLYLSHGLWQENCSLPLCTIHLAKQRQRQRFTAGSRIPGECKLDDNGSTCSTKAHYCTVPGGSSLVDMILCSNGCGGPQTMPRRDGASIGPSPH